MILPTSTPNPSPCLQQQSQTMGRYACGHNRHRGPLERTRCKRPRRQNLGHNCGKLRLRRPRVRCGHSVAVARWCRRVYAHVVFHRRYNRRQKLGAGTYGLFILLEPDSVVLIFSKNPESWGTYFYDPEEEVLRVTGARKKTKKKAVNG